MKAATAYPMNSSCGVVHSFSAPRLFSERFIHCKHSGTVPALYLNDWKMDTDTKNARTEANARTAYTQAQRDLPLGKTIAQSSPILAHARGGCRGGFALVDGRAPLFW